MPQIQYSVRDYPHKYALDSDGSFNEDDGEVLAEIAAEHYHSTHDGWEAQWPIRFTIYVGGEPIGAFNVELDVEPSFTASPSEEK